MNKKKEYNMMKNKQESSNSVQEKAQKKVEKKRIMENERLLTCLEFLV